MQIEIRKAEPRDAKPWAKIRKECWLQVYPNEKYNITREDILLKDFDSPEAIESWQDSFLNRTDCKYYSAIIDDKIVGMCISYPYHEDYNEIGALYIDISCQKKGIGRTLMERAFEDFDNTKKTILKVVTYNDNAIGFYKHMGFRIVGPFDDPHGHLPNGKKLPETLMERECQQ